MKPGIDIIILNYNNTGLIEKCLNGILNNTFCDYKLIVIDQGSIDGSQDYLKGSSIPHKLILNKENTGAWEGRNQGVREAEHEWQMFFDSDTEIRDPAWDAKMLEEGKDPKVGLVEAKVELYNGDLRFAGFAGSMIRNEVFRELGLFDHHFIIGGDNDFWVKFYWNGKFQIRYCKTTDIFHYCGGTINRGCMKEQSKALHQAYREDMMRLKYSDKFLNMTVCRMNNKRIDEEFKMGWRK